jgi:hypothetical protein
MRYKQSNSEDKAMRIFIPLTLCAVLAGCAAGAPSPYALKQQANEAKRLEDELAGFTPGKPKSCLSIRDIGGPESFGENTLIFRVGRNLLYRNETRGSCGRVGHGDALITQVWGSQLCKGDIARSADLTAGFQSGACSLGDFVPYRK